MAVDPGRHVHESTAITRVRKAETAANDEKSARFIEAARELGCDESPEAFEAAVKRVARHKMVEDKPDGKLQKIPK